MKMKIELLKNHIHGGKKKNPGDIIYLDEASAKWLIDIKVAKFASDKVVKQLSNKGK